MPENDASITLTPGTLPAGFCFQTWQQVYNAFISLTTGFLPGAYTTVNAGSTEPVADDRSKPWFRYNNDGSPDKWYVYFGGGWVSPFPLSYDTKTLYIYIGSTTELKTKDGGEDIGSDAPTDRTGPFWEVDSTIAAKFPLPVGTLPSGTVVALASAGGSETVTLTDVQVPPHTHNFQPPDNANSTSGSGKYSTGSDATEGTITSYPTTSALGNASGGTDSHSNMPPYYGVYLIKRTSRLYYRV